MTTAESIKAMRAAVGCIDKVITIHEGGNPYVTDVLYHSAKCQRDYLVLEIEKTERIRDAHIETITHLTGRAETTVGRVYASPLA